MLYFQNHFSFLARQRICYRASGCNSTDEVPALSVDDCCINRANGLYYDSGTGCMQCNSKSLK